MDTRYTIGKFHRKWVTLLQSMDDGQFACTFYHPGSGETVPLDRCLGMYAWHGKHHLAHIANRSSHSCREA